jgi:outer membrane lipoprotein-sorting protein
MMIRFLACVALFTTVFLTSLQAQKKPADLTKPATLDAENPLVAYPHFSATMSGGFLKEDPRRIYRSGNLLRVDMDGGYYRVTDLDKKIMWSVRPERCMKIEQPDARSYPFTLFPNTKFEPPSSETKETIDGHTCTIERATFTPEEFPTLKSTMKLWKADDLQGFPIKIEVAHSSRTLTVTYKDVSLETPDTKLFQLPATCEDFATGEKKPTAKPAATPSKPALKKPQS